jgi:competence protein ComEC
MRKTRTAVTRIASGLAALLLGVLALNVSISMAVAGTLEKKSGEAAFYMVDVGSGNCVVVVSPSGQVMMLDTGTPEMAKRVLAFLAENGIKKLDYLLVSHFHPDHMGGAAKIIDTMPVAHVVDHGDSVEYGKSDDWWKQRRRPWFYRGEGKKYDESIDVYVAARNKTDHIVVKAGDRVPFDELKVTVVSAAGKVLLKPLPGAGKPNPAGAEFERRAEDDAEDQQSVGVVMRYGKFRFIDLGDLTWNIANALFCPKNMVGTVDAYVVTHHGQSLPRQMGEYYYGLSSCPPSEVKGLNPRVALLTLGRWGHQYGNSDALKLVHSMPGLDLWQTEFIRAGGELGWNGPEVCIANLGETDSKVPYIKLTAHADGSFTVTNNRNGFSKDYPPRQ